ncbi:cytochrome P450 4C1-like isoform X2 [Contarinia nasturtii]|uniref:cytochrome P450 4C1-like isoform X2 n=1 Tax=Contarinia nasturtii TaxID=265458 RepID=UPI0012D38345|nr:cytochrome P450 4C1-like isoform X2 [Contarinia nasturtii]
MIAVTLIVMFVIWAIIKYILTMRHTESFVKNVKFQTFFVPFIGNLLSLVGKSPVEIFKTLIKSLAQKDTPLKFYIGTKLFVTLNKPEDVKEILMSPNCFDRPFTSELVPFKNGILNERSAARWKPLRKLLNPMFNLKTLKSFIPVFNVKSRIMLKELRDEVGRPEFNLLHYTSACSLDSICSTVMGIDIDLKSNRGKEFIESVKNVLGFTIQRCSQPWTYFDSIFRWTNLYKQEQENCAIIRNLSNMVFEEKTKALLAAKCDNPSGNSEYQWNKAHLSFIPLYIEGKMSEELVKQQIESFLIAGYETTGSATAFAILALAMHPHIQEQVFDELRLVYESQDEETTNEHIQKLHLLDRVIKETLRLFPTVPNILRSTSDMVSISDCTLPKDTSVILSIFTMHRRKDVWGDADEFNPDHFLPENVEKRHPFAFVPFGGGPRNCIGHQYALYSIKVMLSAILRNFQFSTQLTMSDLDLSFDITLKLKNKHLVRLVHRSW